VLWPKRDAPHFADPGRELSWAVLGIAGTLILGFLYVQRLLIPAEASPLIDVANQLIVFTPILLVPLFRRHPLATLWLPTDRVFIRIMTGVLLAIVALTTFVWTAVENPGWIDAMRAVYNHRNLPSLLQLLLEDVAAAILSVRVAGVLGPRAAPLLAAVLLAASHLTASGVAAGGAVFERAAVDAVLGAAVVAVVQRSADVWWFWGVHFAMDMSQYATGQLS
jgi:hypothetical protein